MKQHIAMYESVLPGYYLAPEDIIAEGDRESCAQPCMGSTMGRSWAPRRPARPLPSR